MRCDDLIRELATPTGALDRLEMANHLAACPACSEQSRRAARLDRIWEATRPSEPSGELMDTLWARASDELDARQPLETLKFERIRPRRRLAIAAFVLAQAAAILLAALALFGTGSPKPVEVAQLDFFVESDQVAVVRIGKDNATRIEIVDQSHLFDSSQLPDSTPHDEIADMETKGSTLGVVATVQ